MMYKRTWLPHTQRQCTTVHPPDYSPFWGVQKRRRGSDAWCAMDPRGLGVMLGEGGISRL